MCACMRVRDRMFWTAFILWNIWHNKPSSWFLLIYCFSKGIEIFIAPFKTSDSLVICKFELIFQGNSIFLFAIEIKIVYIGDLSVSIAMQIVEERSKWHITSHLLHFILFQSTKVKFSNKIVASTVSCANLLIVYGKFKYFRGVPL